MMNQIEGVLSYWKHHPEKGPQTVAVTVLLAPLLAVIAFGPIGAIIFFAQLLMYLLAVVSLALALLLFMWLLTWAGHLWDDDRNLAVACALWSVVPLGCGVVFYRFVGQFLSQRSGEFMAIHLPGA